MPTDAAPKKRSPAEAARELYSPYFDTRTDRALQKGMAAFAKLPQDVQLYVCAHLAYLAALQGGKVLVRLDEVRATGEESAGTLEALSEALLSSLEGEDPPEPGSQVEDEPPTQEPPEAPLRHPFFKALAGGLDVDDGGEDSSDPPSGEPA